MYKIETAVMFDGVAHHLIVGIELIRERGGQRRNMLKAHVCHNIHIQCGTHDAMHGTCQRTAHRIRNSYLFKSLGDEQRNSSGFTWRGHRPSTPILCQELNPPTYGEFVRGGGRMTLSNAAERQCLHGFVQTIHNGNFFPSGHTPYKLNLHGLHFGWVSE